MKKLLIVVPIFLAACQPTMHQLGYTSDNLVSIEYSAYAMTPTLMPEAMDMDHFVQNWHRLMSISK